jgi:hypothetical protein
MPGDRTPEPGDVYGAEPSVLLGGDAHPAKRRVAALEPVVGMPWWRTLGRTTTSARQGDLDSPVELSCNLDKPGWWSLRFQHTVETRHFGNSTLCPLYGRLPEPERSRLLKYWEDHKYG